MFKLLYTILTIMFFDNRIYSEFEIIQDLPKINAPAIIFNHFDDGIGNQLFQYACAYNLAKKHNLNLYISLDTVKERLFKPHTRDYTLDYFDIPQNNIIDRQKLKFINYKKIDEIDILEGKVSNTEILFLDDYCESEIFFVEFKNEIKKLFKFKEDKISAIQEHAVYRDIIDTESVCVHIRRGDFAKISQNWALPIVYQIKAMELTRTYLKNPKFYIFSDDTDYAKQNLKKFPSLVFVSEYNFPTILEFYLMTKCNHHIIANSTFSWWAGYLNDNPEKIVIAPFPRYLDKLYEELFHDSQLRDHKRNIYQNFPYPKDWIKINPFDKG